MFFILFILWIAFNARITLEIVLVGLAVSAAIYAFCWKFLGYSPNKEVSMVKKIPTFILYCGILLKEIFTANIIVLKLLITGKKVKPVMCHFKVNLKSDSMRVLLSYSITLTPGTITAELIDDEFIVHCLDESLVAGLVDGGFIKVLQKLES